MTAYAYTIDRAIHPRYGTPAEASWSVAQGLRLDDADVGPWLLGSTALCELLADHPEQDIFAWRVRVWRGHTATGAPAVTVDWEEVRDAAYAWRRTV
jgi:hypothetical protein